MSKLAECAPRHASGELSAWEAFVVLRELLSRSESNLKTTGLRCLARQSRRSRRGTLRSKCTNRDKQDCKKRPLWPAGAAQRHRRRTKREEVTLGPSRLCNPPHQLHQLQPPPKANNHCQRPREVGGSLTPAEPEVRQRFALPAKRSGGGGKIQIVLIVGKIRQIALRRVLQR